MNIQKLNFLLLVLIVILFSCKDDKPVDKDNLSPTVELYLENYMHTFVQFDTVVMTAHVEDQDGVVEKVKFYKGGELLSEDVVAPFIYSWIVNEPGDYNLTAIAFDDDGSWAESLPTEITVVSGTEPRVEIQNPSNGFTQKEGSDAVIECQAWDYDGTIEKIEVYFNNNLLNTHFADECKDTVHFLQVGTFTVKAIAFDNDGNISKPDEIVVHVNPNLIPVIEIYQNYSTDYWAGQYMVVNFEASDNDGSVRKVELYANNTLVAVDSTDLFNDIYWTDILSGNWDLQAKAYDNSGGVGLSNILTVKVNHRLAIDGIITCIEAGGDPQTAFALVGDKNELLIINPQAGLISKTFTFPQPQPRRMEYSAIDNKLYIVSDFAGDVYIFNVNTESFSSFNFSSSGDGRDISISPGTRRIYVGASDGFYIMNMDNGSVLNEDHSDECWNLAVMNNVSKLFVNLDGYSDNFKRFSVQNDELVLEETIDGSDEACQSMIVTSDNSKLILPCLSYSSNVTAFNPLLMTDVLGVYNVGTYPDQVCVSADANYLFTDCFENLQVFNAKTYVYLQNYIIPNISDYTRLGLNNDGSVVLVFTYDEYYDKDYYLYFIEKEW